MATHAIFEELAVNYDLIEIDLAKNMQKSPEYLAINPNGKVPTLVHKGEVIYESSAILMYVLDQYPQSGLSPDLMSSKRGVYYQYMSWMSNTLQEAANRWAHPEQFVNGDTNLQQVVDKASEELARCWKVIDQALESDGPWLLGEQLSGADFHLFMVAYWSRRYTSRAQDWPNVNKHYHSMLKRDAVQKMMLQESLV